MFAGSFLIGLLPTFLKASQRVLNLIAILGAGLLVGVALIVIIPEGTFALYNAYEAEGKILISNGKEFKNETQFYLGVTLIGGFLIMVFLDQGFIILKESFFSKHEESLEDDRYEEIKDGQCHFTQNKQNHKIVCETPEKL